MTHKEFVDAVYVYDRVLSMLVDEACDAHEPHRVVRLMSERRRVETMERTLVNLGVFTK